LSVARSQAVCGRSASWLCSFSCGRPCWPINGEYHFRQWGFGIDEDSRILTASLETFALLALGMYVTHSELPGSAVLVLFVVGTPALIASRRLVRFFIHRLWASGVGRERVLLVGAPDPVAQLTKVLHRERWLGLTPVGELHPGEELCEGAFTEPGDIVDAVSEFDADIVIFCDGAFHIGTDFNLLARHLERQEVHLVVVPTLSDISAHRMGMVPAAGMPLIFVEKPHAQRALSPSKRALDVLAAGVALLLVAPALALVALLIKLEDAGPVIFRQERIGRAGRPFGMLKLRSMVIDAEQLLPQGGEGAHDDGNGMLFKLHDDPRVTRVGRFIRRFSIDELPQLWNVLTGEMSIVGPRPALPCEVAKYLPTVRRRLDVRPGITGLWQVSGRSDLSWEDTVRLDLYYVDNWSMLQDAAILFRTARAILARSGAY
jgi:exopolysaccharide biosynthesis polyprenyl glycosylphosphotransferase